MQQLIMCMVMKEIVEFIKIQNNIKYLNQK